MKLLPGDEIITQFRAGNRKAFGAIYSYYYRYVFVIGYAILRDGDAARDIASEIFLKLWGQRRKFYKPGEIKGWLIVACRRASLNELRARQRRQMTEKELGLLLPKQLPSYEQQLMEVEAVIELLRQLDALPPRCREVLQLLFFHGRKTAEVAELLGISPVTVQTHKMNALMKLRAFKKVLIR